MATWFCCGNRTLNWPAGSLRLLAELGVKFKLIDAEAARLEPGLNPERRCMRLCTCRRRGRQLQAVRSPPAGEARRLGATFRFQ